MAKKVPWQNWFEESLPRENGKWRQDHHEMGAMLVLRLGRLVGKAFNMERDHAREKGKDYLLGVPEC